MTPEAVTFILGAFLPPLIDLVNRRIADAKVRYLVSVAFCFVLAVVVAILTNSFNFKDILLGISSSAISAQAIYKLYWEGSALRSPSKV